MRIVRIWIMTVAFVLAGTSIFAQQGPLPGPYDDDMGMDNPQARGAQPSEEKREEVRKKMEAVRIWKLTEELKLDAGSSAKLASLLSSLNQQRRDIMQEQKKNMEELQTSLQTQKPDESKLKTLLDKLNKNHLAMQDLREKELIGLKDLLTIEQQARYALFQQKFMREMRGMISGARGGMGQGRRGSGPLQENPGRQQGPR